MPQQDQYGGSTYGPTPDWTPGNQAPAVPAAPVGTLPSTPASAPALGSAPNIWDALGGFSSVSEAEILSALSPQRQAAPMRMPAWYTRELPQPGQLIQDRTPMVGAGNASGQGIGNAINATIHAFASFKAARDKNIQMQDAEKVQRFMETQDGIDQANQILKVYGPNSPEGIAAQQTIDTNTAHRNEMLSDKKFEKLIETGFNMSLTDPSQNKTPEHGIVQKGIDLFRFRKQAQMRAQNRQPYTPQQAAAIGQRFESARPQMMGPSQYAMQRIQARLGFDQSRQAMIKDMLLYRGRIDEAQINAMSAWEVERLRSATTLRAASEKLGQEYDLKAFQAAVDVVAEEAKQQITSGNVNTIIKDIASLAEANARSGTNQEETLSRMDIRGKQEQDDGNDDRVQEIRRDQDEVRRIGAEREREYNLTMQIMQMRLAAAGYDLSGKSIGGAPGVGGGVGAGGGAPSIPGVPLTPGDPHVGGGLGITPGGAGAGASTPAPAPAPSPPPKPAESHPNIQGRDATTGKMVDYTWDNKLNKYVPVKEPDYTPSSKPFGPRGGGTSGAGTGAGGSGSTPSGTGASINPRTGQPWNRGTLPAEQSILRELYNFSLGDSYNV